LARPLARISIGCYRVAKAIDEWRACLARGIALRLSSVEMIEKYYAAHLKTRLDAAAINIMKPRPKKKTIAKKGPGRVEAIHLTDEV
jgi:hypothetical protein